MSIKVTYIYSACIKIETADTSILCDPWFTDGIYDGSWYQYPKLEAPLEKIGRVDFIWVSHIHPDHYDTAFLKKYFAEYPQARLLISDFKHNFLVKKMQADGFKPEIINSFKLGTTEIIAVPNENGSKSDIDSALIVKSDGHSVVNMNDNQYNQEHIDFIKSIAPTPEIALLSYTGAGPYPQTYYDDKVKLAELAAKKKEAFFQRYRQMQQALQPKVTIPFAGKYILGGHLTDLNEYRGVADAVEVAEFDNTAVILDDGGDAYIDTRDLRPSRLRTKPYDAAALGKYLTEIKDQPFKYDKYFSGLVVEATPVMLLMPQAYKKAVLASECTEDYFFCIRFRDKWLAMNANSKNQSYQVLENVSQLTPRSEVIIDHRYLFGLLTGVFHWNNAEVGSQFFTKRVPDIYNRSAQSFLNFLRV